jgi:hypothetical protein
MRKLIFGLTAGLLSVVGLAGAPSVAVADPGHGHHGGWEHHHHAHRPYHSGGYYAPSPRYYSVPVVPGYYGTPYGSYYSAPVYPNYYYATPSFNFSYYGPNAGFSLGF